MFIFPFITNTVLINLNKYGGRKLSGRTFSTVFNSKLKKTASFSRSLESVLFFWQSDSVSYISQCFFQEFLVYAAPNYNIYLNVKTFVTLILLLISNLIFILDKIL